MSASDDDSVKLRIQLEILKERIKHLETQKNQQGKELIQLNSYLEQKHIEIVKMRDERDDLRIKWEVMGIEIKHLQASLTQNSQSTVKKKSFIKRQGFLAALIFFLSTGLASWGINLLTQKPLSVLDVTAGAGLVGFAFVAYVIATLMTTLFTEGGN